MPILKQIAGHGSCVPVQRYLEKNGRALARDFMNFEDAPEASSMAPPALGPEIDWAKIMDEFRHSEGKDKPWKGQPARTFKHFVLSPSPEDQIDLAMLRELTIAWSQKYFSEYHVAIVYHDDNESNIPHAHVVVNNTNLVTTNRLHHEDPKELNRGLQKLAKERGLHALSNETPEAKTGFERLSRKGQASQTKPITLQEEYRNQAERRAEKEQGYSWVADIRSRVSVAKGLARNQEEFSRILKMMGVEIADNSANAKRRDWVYSLADSPTRKVSGERLGASYGKYALERSLTGARTQHLPDASSREFLRIAKHAVELKDLGELTTLSDVLKTCSKWHISSIDAATTVLALQHSRLDTAANTYQEKRIQANIAQLESTRDFLRQHSILPEHEPQKKGSSSNPHNWSSESASRNWNEPAREHERDTREGWNR